MLRTRLAPSPTGSLHLGNARTFLVNWLLAKQRGARVLLRIEDLDRARSRAEHVAAAIDDLRWLGLAWDEGPLFQSARLERYEAAFARLRECGAIYPCVCTRKEVALAASAPHAEDEPLLYPGTCRRRFADAEEAARIGRRPPAWRFAVPDGVVPFEDGFLGPVALDPSRHGGDFVVRSFDGTFAYQLAVVVDDGESGVTDVVRGDDLVSSTPRQLLLHRALGFAAPRFLHVPLVVNANGKRLSKRHGDLDLTTLRARGVDPRTLIARLAASLGIDDIGAAATAADLVARFDLATMPRAPVSLGSEDDGDGMKGPRRPRA